MEPAHNEEDWLAVVAHQIFSGLSTDHETIHVVASQNLGRSHSLIIQSRRPEIFCPTFIEMGHRIARSHPVIKTLDLRSHGCLKLSLRAFNEVKEVNITICIECELFPLDMPCDVLAAPFAFTRLFRAGD